jgi:hypothetical protein
MKKLFSLLFSVAFLLVFVSLFSQKSVALFSTLFNNAYKKYSISSAPSSCTKVNAVPNCCAASNIACQADYAVLFATYACYSCPSPAAPTGLTGNFGGLFGTLTGSSATTAYFSWNAVSGASYYYIYYHVTGASVVSGIKVTGGAHSYSTYLGRVTVGSWGVQSCSNADVCSSTVEGRSFSAPPACSAVGTACGGAYGTCCSETTCLSGKQFCAKNCNTYSGHSCTMNKSSCTSGSIVSDPTDCLNTDLSSVCCIASGGSGSTPTPKPSTPTPSTGGGGSTPTTKPAAPTLNAPTCTPTTSPTTETFSWTTGANTSGTFLYYCDVTYAGAHGVQCTKDSAVSTSTQRWGWFLLQGGKATTSPQQIPVVSVPFTSTSTSLTAGDNYVAFVRAYNGSLSNFTDSTDVAFPGGSCGGVTPTPNPTGSTSVNLIVGLDGIGTTGDNANPDYASKPNAAGSTQNPSQTEKYAHVGVFDGNNTLVSDSEGKIKYVSDTTNANYGKFTGNVALAASITSGAYTVKVKVDGHLRKAIPGIQTITAGQANSMAAIRAVAGDVVVTPDAEFNKLNLNDYNVLMSCSSNYSPDNGALCQTDPAYALRADLDDNGTVNMFDVTLFLREYSVQNGD